VIILDGKTLLEFISVTSTAGFFLKGKWKARKRNGQFCLRIDYQRYLVYYYEYSRVLHSMFIRCWRLESASAYGNSVGFEKVAFG